MTIEEKAISNFRAGNIPDISHIKIGKEFRDENNNLCRNENGKKIKLVENDPGFNNLCTAYRAMRADARKEEEKRKNTKWFWMKDDGNWTDYILYANKGFKEKYPNGITEDDIRYHRYTYEINKN